MENLKLKTIEGRFLAGIVTFNPCIERLKENLGAIFSQVDHVVIVDNHSKNISSIRELTKQFDNVSIIELSDNYGIARALNEIGDYGVNKGYDFFLTLDQDSVMLEGTIAKYKKYLHLPKLGIINCQNIDRNGYHHHKYEEIVEKDVITSGSLMPTEVFKKGIRFDENLFIDCVDFDMDINLRHRGYKVYELPFEGLVHEVGDIEHPRFLWTRITVFNHSAFRRYYIQRNTIILWKKWGRNEAKKLINLNIQRFIKTLLYEDKKFQKSVNQIRGLIDGIKYKVH